MVRKGRVSSVDLILRSARITFPDMDNIVSGEIPIAQGLSVAVNDVVAVAFFSSSKSDALIISVF